MSIGKRAGALADEFVAMAPEARRAMTYAERQCAALAIIVSNGREIHVSVGDSTFWVRDLYLDDDESRAMSDAGWTNSGRGWWVL